MHLILSLGLILGGGVKVILGSEEQINHSQVKASEANYLGKQFVGSGYTTFEYNGKTSYISKDGTRVYRPPSQKTNSTFTNTGTQANFEYRVRNPDTGKWEITKNGHIDIIVE